MLPKIMKRKVEGKIRIKVRGNRESKNWENEEREERMRENGLKKYAEEERQIKMTAEWKKKEKLVMFYGILTLVGYFMLNPVCVYVYQISIICQKISL